MLDTKQLFRYVCISLLSAGCNLVLSAQLTPSADYKLEEEILAAEALQIIAEVTYVEQGIGLRGDTKISLEHWQERYLESLDKNQNDLLDGLELKAMWSQYEEKVAYIDKNHDRKISLQELKKYKAAAQQLYLERLAEFSVVLAKWEKEVSKIKSMSRNSGNIAH
tara:strand:- start:1396 stop:1890 length:495 start_codon:yes stop_codon:yes gene_type:complete